jgi:hypothetical protein
VSADFAISQRGTRPRRRGAIIGAAAIALLAGLVSAALAASTNFTEPATSPVQVGAGPVSIVAADLDGDGDRDLATANVSGGNVTVLKNTGTGVFHEPASSPEDAGSFPDFITSADIDGDLDPDLVVANQVSNDLTILRNNGHGNFIEPVTSPEPAGETPVSIAAADVDGDGDQDLAVADHLATANVLILRNNGNGNFAATPSSPLNAGNEPSSIAAADLDGDLDPDLAVANQQSNNVTLLRNIGSGSFREPPASPEFAGQFPQGIVAANLDPGTDVDLAIANQGPPGTVTILRNTGTALNFSEPATSPEPVGMRPFKVVAADFDADLDQDLATANRDSGNSTILANGGALDFVEPATSPESAGNLAQSLAATDLDGDLDPDLAIANQGASTVTILRNR